MHPMKIYYLNGSMVWLDPETAPIEAIPICKSKKPVEVEEKAKPTTTTKAKKATANKSRKAADNK